MLEAIDIVWKQKEGAAAQEANRIRHRIIQLEESIRLQAEAITDPGNVTIREELRAAIDRKKLEVTELEEQLEGLAKKDTISRERFLQFAFEFIDNAGSKFLEIPPENRLRCKRLLFPAGFYINENNKVYTPK